MPLRYINGVFFGEAVVPEGVGRLWEVPAWFAKGIRGAGPQGNPYLKKKNPAVSIVHDQGSS